VRLVDNADNSAGTGSEAIYVNTLIVPSGANLDLNGLHLYARAAQIGGTITGGTVTMIPDGGPLAFATATAGTIATSGELDDWTFLGRAGKAVQVLVGTGGGSLFQPVSPAVNLAQVQLVDPSGNVVATATNSPAGTDATLQAVSLPADGVYHLLVQADPAHATS